MDEQVFADGIGTISMISGTVRLDLMSYSPTELDGSGQPRPVFRQRVIMSLEAFLGAAEKIQEAAKALSARNPQPEVTPPPAHVPPAPPPPTPIAVEPEQHTPLKPPFP